MPAAAEAEYSRRYRTANPEKVRAYKREYYLRNREAVLARVASAYRRRREATVSVSPVTEAFKIWSRT